MIETSLASNPSPAHRPARRKHQHQHQHQHQQDDNLRPWTTARCQRLLRQLQCRLTSLRKMIFEAKKPAPAGLSKRPGLYEDQQPPKRTRYTYAQRRQSTGRSVSKEPELKTPPRVVRPLGDMKFGQCSPASGRVDFSTPMLRKIRDQSRTPDSSVSMLGKTAAIPQSLISDLNSLRSSSPGGHYRIYDAIFGWLDGMLRATENKASAPHPKSLFGMCLRRIPGVMAHIEAWDRQNSEQSGNSSMWETSNVSLELYGQLEAFGEGGKGWNPLKLVVRSQALSILTEAVSEGLFEPAFVCVLAELCLYLKCGEAAARLVSSLNSRLIGPQSSMSTLSENTTTLPLGSIVNSLHGKRSPGASFDCLSQLMQAKRIPLAWLSSRGFRSAWTSSLEAMTTERPAPSVLEFVRTSLSLLAINDGKERWSRQSNREQTLISVTAAVAATAITVGPGGERQGRGFRRLLQALDLCVNETRLQSRGGRDNGLFILALARYLAMVESGSGDTAAGRQATKECRDLAASNSKGGTAHVQYRQALVLTCSIAQYRGRVCGVACHDMLSRMCDALDGLAFPDWFRAGLRTDGAFVLARKTKDLRDLAFAERLRAGPVREPRTIFSGWRWEEGISEWVHVVQQQKQQHQTSPARRSGRGRRRAGAGAGVGAGAGAGVGVGAGATLSAEDGGGGGRGNRPPERREMNEDDELGSGSDTVSVASRSQTRRSLLIPAVAETDGVRGEGGDGGGGGGGGGRAIAIAIRGTVAARAARRLLVARRGRNTGRGVSQMGKDDDDGDELCLSV